MYSIIITDYCSIPKSLEMIGRLLDQCNTNKELLHFIVVDNSNQKKGADYLKKNRIPYTVDLIGGKPVYNFVYQGIKIWIADAKENGGYAKGNNFGAAVSSALFDDCYYIFSNNDLEFPDTFQMEELAYVILKRPEVGIIGVNIVSPSGSRQNPRIVKGFLSQTILWDFNVMWFGCRFNKWLWNLDEDSCEGETGWVSGSFMFVSRNAFLEIQGFDENTFLYCEEVILSERMRRKKFITYYYPKIRVVHHHHGTNTKKLRRIGHKSKMYYYHEYRNIPTIYCKIADILFEVCENGYYIWHKVIKENLKR